VTEKVCKRSISIEPIKQFGAEEIIRALGAPFIDVRYVGGCIRDSILGRPVSDVDLATPDTPQTVITKVVKAGLRAIPTGLSYGTITVFSQGSGFEVTTLRRDTASYGRHAEVEFTLDWKEDASRRDFTFNAMSARPDGTLFDYYGGECDARAGRVRFIGDPRDRIREDYLRILRYFRFLALYGQEKPSQDILEACRDLREGLNKLSVERIRDEIVKVLNVPEPGPAIDALNQTRILQQIFPEGSELETLRSLLNLEGKRTVQESPLMWHSRLSALIPNDQQKVYQAAKRLKLSNIDANALAQIQKAATEARLILSQGKYEHFFYSYKPKILRTAVLVAWARDVHASSPDWESLYQETLKWSPKTFPLRGQDVREMGLSEGPRVGVLLEQLEQEWIDGGFQESADDLRRRLKALIV